MNDREVYECEHYRERGTIRWLDDPLYGDVLLQSGHSVGLLSKTPRRTNWIWRPVGGDNVKIYRDWLGIPLSKIEEWYNKAWI
jgi:crotonobetainyl-CoA:carnitine CoA-transferase CaiB-like acyl-CoA transferase